MSTLQVAKKGGPYTKAQQEKRRTQVYEMHFEKGCSAVNIAAKLGINRNTVNDDIKYWYSEIALQIGQDNLGGVFLRQIERIEIQRKRLLDELEKQTDFDTRFRLEKLLFEIEHKVAILVSKMTDSKILDGFDKTEEISEVEISEIVRSVAFSCGTMHTDKISEEEMLECVISMKKCDPEYAENVFGTMRSLGLNLFYDTSSDFDDSYDLLSFGTARGFIKEKEKDALLKKLDEDDQKEKLRCDEIEKKYEKMYGSDQSEWPESICDKMNKEISG